MFKQESEFHDKEGLALWNPTQGVAYQIAGALNRMGTRMSALVEDASESKKFSALTMSTQVVDPNASPQFKTHHPFETFVYTLDPWLTRPMESKDLTEISKSIEKALKIYESLKKTFSSITGLWVFSLELLGNKNFYFSDAMRSLFRDESHSFVWAPLSFSFRDHFLFDRSLELIKNNPALFEMKSKIDFDLKPIFAGDIAALMVTLTQKNNLGRHFYLPVGTENLESFKYKFFQNFKFLNSANWMEKLAARLEAKSWDDFVFNDIDINSKTNFKITDLDLPFKVENIYEVFPTSPISFDRAFSILKRSLEKHPQTELIFPPVQAP